MASDDWGQNLHLDNGKSTEEYTWERIMLSLTKHNRNNFLLIALDKSYFIPEILFQEDVAVSTVWKCNLIFLAENIPDDAWILARINVYLVFWEEYS